MSVLLRVTKPCPQLLPLIEHQGFDNLPQSPIEKREEKLSMKIETKSSLMQVESLLEGAPALLFSRF